MNCKWIRIKVCCLFRGHDLGSEHSSMNGLAWSGAVAALHAPKRGANNNNSNKTMMAGNSIIPRELMGTFSGMDGVWRRSCAVL